jgi:hypothetical protein
VQPDGTVRESGSIIGEVEPDGTLRRSGSILGEIESDGTIRRSGSIWGSASAAETPEQRRAVAAALYFFSGDF